MLRRMLVALLFATSIGACASAGSLSPAPPPSIAGFPASPPPPPWTHLEPSEPFYDVPFDAAFDEASAGVAYGDGFVLVGRTANKEGHWRGGIWSSVDGIDWNLVSADDAQFDNTYLFNIATNGTRLVALGWGVPWAERRGHYIAWVSDDGVSWERHDVEGTDLGQVHVDGIVGSGSGFLAWGDREDRHGMLLRSVDGIAWEAIDYPGGADANIRSVAPLGAGFVAVGAAFDAEVTIGGPSDAARAWWSPDGRDWIRADVTGAWSLTGVYPGAGGVYAVGAHECSRCVGPRLTWGSADGRSWQHLGDEAQLYPFVASNGSQIAAFDWQGDRSITLSSDGLLWTKVIARLPAADHDAGIVVGRTGVLLLMARTPIGADGVRDIHQGVLFLRGS